MLFFANDRVSGGRPKKTYLSTLKNARDVYDSNLKDSGGNLRVGWHKNDGSPSKIPKPGQKVYEELRDKSKEEIWAIISQYIKEKEVSQYPLETVLKRAVEILDDTQEEFRKGLEGRTTPVWADRIERNPKLRKAAIQVHGASCKICSFNFGKVYGEWGADWAEVHHLKPLSKNKGEQRETNIHEDLIVVCSNCHRMLHKGKELLTPEELRSKIEGQNAPSREPDDQK